MSETTLFNDHGVLYLTGETSDEWLWMEYES